MIRKYRERGAALITVMLIVAIVSVVAVEMARRGMNSVGRTALSIGSQQAQEYALGLEAWARHLLREDALSGRDLDHRGEAWATPLLALPIEGGDLSGQIYDVSGLFNLNDLVFGTEGQRSLARRRFERLLTVLGLRVEIAAALDDWLDANAQPQVRGAEDGAYLSAPIPYRAANQPMIHPSELRLIVGVNAENWAKLSPHVATLPRRILLNLNTATPAVLASLDEGLELGRAESLARDGGARWRNQDEFLRAAQLTQFPTEVGFQSEFFITLADLKLGEGRFRYFSFLERDGVNGSTRVLQRGRGDYLTLPLTSASQ